jgi:mono/diheme cytochrome c family protein
MLTGRPPFEGVTPLDTLLRVLSQDPEPPSRVLPKVPRDLETICLKCLEKKPGRRYATAEALADDLQRFRTGLPIAARSITLAGRTVKWARRRPEIAALTLLLMLTAVGLFAAIWSRYRTLQESRLAAEQSAPKVRQILHRYCYQCHGQDPTKTEGDLNILDYDVLLNPERKLVVASDWKESRLIHRIEDGSMPPENEEEFPRLASEELEVLKGWVMGGAPRFPDSDLGESEPAPTELSVQVKKIFQMNCHECHRFSNAKQGIKILNHDLLVNKRKVIVPGQPEQSPLYQLMITSDPKKVMPPLEFALMSERDIEKVRRWIAEGAPPFPRTHVKKPAAKENPIKQP